MKIYTPLPLIDSNIYLFGGHQRTVSGGWQFFEQKHQAFELMVIVEGAQTTEIRNLAKYTYGPGDAMIISPGTLHTNRNASETAEMTYICMHFNIESLELKSEVISKIANSVLPADTQAAKLVNRVATKLIQLVQDSTLSPQQTKIEIEIAYLRFLSDLISLLKTVDLRKTTKYSEQEAKIGRSMATLVKEYIDQDITQEFSVADICQELGISSGYGYRTFKKVYGITPLRYIEQEKYQKAKTLLGSPELTVEEVAYRIGTSNTSNFTKQFKKWSGITPSKFQHHLLKRRAVTALKESGYFE